MKVIEWIFNTTIGKLFNIWLLLNLNNKYCFWRIDGFTFKRIYKFRKVSPEDI